jgi:hypothetical protein
LSAHGATMSSSPAMSSRKLVKRFSLVCFGGQVRR